MDIIYNLFIISSLLLFFNVLGRAILSVSGLKINPLKVDLFSILLGLLVSVFLYAAYLTTLKTVLWGIPIALILTWLFYKEARIPKFNREYLTNWDLKSISIILIPSLVWTTYYFIQFIEYTYVDGNIRVVHPDMLFYVKIGEIISQSGAENTLGNLNLYEPNLGSTPYHYFEIYLNQMIHSIYRINGVVSYLQIVFPLSLSLVSAIISGIFLDYLPRAKRFIVIGSAILLVFICGFHLPLPITEAGGYTMNLTNQAVAKYAFPFMFILLAIWSLFRESNLKFTLILWPVAIVSYATFAPIAFVTLGVIVFNLLFIAKSRTKESVFLLIANILLATFMVLYYQVFKVDPSLNIMEINAGLALSTILSEMKGFINIFVGSHVYYWLDYGIYALFFIAITIIGRKYLPSKLSPRRLLDNKVIVPILIFWGGLISWGLLRNVHIDAFQTFIIPVAYTSNALLILLFISFLSKYDSHNSLRVFIMSFLVIASINGIYDTVSNSYIYNGERFSSHQCSTDFYDRTREALETDAEYNNRIAIFNPDPVYGESYPIGIFFYMQNSRTSLLCISPELMVEKKITNIVAPFHQFYLNNQDLSIEEAQLSFVKKYDIHYFLTRVNDLVPSNMMSASTLVAADSINKFYLYRVN